MKKFIASFLTILFSTVTFFSAALPVRAETESYLVTPGSSTPSTGFGGGRIYFSTRINLNYINGEVILSRNPDGTGAIDVADGFQVINSQVDHNNTQKVYTYNASTDNCNTITSTIPPVNITHLFNTGTNSSLIRFGEWCRNNNPKRISPIYLVIKKPGPQGFLDLPWDYESKGMNFSEASMRITSYFDHQYPLLSSGLSEPGSIRAFSDMISSNGNYSSHDGYDYALLANVRMGDPVLAAASGWATYVSSCAACGNMILIDHENGYQTRYMHMQSDGLVTNVPGQRVRVESRQQIGKVGATGRVFPSGDAGAHIHFSVVQDKNTDGNFNDNIPDGMTDPYGWKSTQADPWEHYSFTYAGQQRTGNKSYYLWKKQIDSFKTILTTQGGTFANGRFTMKLVQNSVPQNSTLQMETTPAVQPSIIMRTIGSTILITIKDSVGNLIKNFSQPFMLDVNFQTEDTSAYKPETLALYSSEDGITWNKEVTQVDWDNKIASAQINHLTYFALMGERKDVTPPITSVNLSGMQGVPSFFRSNVEVNLSTQDNAEGIGIDYTMYRIGESEWQLYKNPLVVSSEGSHTIEFYSADIDENIEEVKSVTFTIDRTPPEAELKFNTQTKEIEIKSVNHEETTIEKNEKYITLKDTAGNTLVLNIKEKERGPNAKLVINSLKYNDEATVDINDTSLLIQQKSLKDLLGFKTLNQKYQVKGEVKIRLEYDEKKDQTKVITVEKGKEKQKEILPGLRLLQITTQNGSINYTY